jgi:hypothetical protein
MCKTNLLPPIQKPHYHTEPAPTIERGSVDQPIKSHDTTFVTE